ncbi:hypothetical protein B0H13DRAFT_1982773 [Mycena leptocephala]|nr:hypothetical protein B0H13DRAFT_1982773 [Mycena leptocephala]
MDRSHRISASKALENIWQARHQIWSNASLHEQLILFEMCQYQPSPSNCYQSWRYKLSC